MNTKHLRATHNLSRSSAVAITNRTPEGVKAFKESPEYAAKQARRAKAEARWGRADRTIVYNKMR